MVGAHVGPGTLTTWYAHMESLDIARGQQVTPGQKIGDIGARGNATGCHLHFETMLNGTLVDPIGLF